MLNVRFTNTESFNFLSQPFKASKHGNFAMHEHFRNGVHDVIICKVLFTQSKHHPKELHM